MTSIEAGSQDPWWHVQSFPGAGRLPIGPSPAARVVGPLLDAYTSSTASACETRPCAPPASSSCAMRGARAGPVSRTARWAEPYREAMLDLKHALEPRGPH
jgi:hypothetical protein